MSNNSNNQGRAYEYAWINSLFDALSSVRGTRIEHNSSWAANEKAWAEIGDEMRALLEMSANAAVDTILELEPLMTENDSDELVLEFQQDGAGTQGDVRDIVVKRNAIAWEIGLSIKHNHEAIKHSRLSHSLDFGKEWYGISCSDTYWDDIKPIFDYLKTEHHKKTKWSELEDKEGDVYIPLLTAFINEVYRAYANDSTMPRKMVEYLIGTKDYYKVISRDGKRLTIIRTFNMHGSLNQPSKMKMSAICVPVVELPSELVTLKFKTGSTNTVEMYLNNGWQLSFRIHNASTTVEPSLKFDVQFIGMPISILNIECKWNNTKPTSLDKRESNETVEKPIPPIPIPVPTAPHDPQPDSPAPDYSVIKIGDKVSHKLFGVGKVTVIDSKKKYIRVAFALSEKRLPFPDAFEMGFLKLQNHN